MIFTKIIIFAVADWLFSVFRQQKIDTEQVHTVVKSRICLPDSTYQRLPELDFFLFAYDQLIFFLVRMEEGT